MSCFASLKAFCMKDYFFSGSKENLSMLFNASDIFIPAILVKPFFFPTEGSQGPLESKSGIQIKLYCVHTK